MKYSEIRNLQVPELRKRLEQSRQALFTAQMKHKMQRLSNMMELRDVRRDIARLETALSALPESAFVSHKSDKKKAEVKGSKEAKKAKLKEVNKKQEKTKKAATITPTTAPELKTKTSSVKKKIVKKETVEEQQPIKKEKQVQSQKKTKKWFGFFGSQQKPSGVVKDGKRSFFRRKSGG